jgi:formamidopyrimidine-DNA glycosylase
VPELPETETIARDLDGALRGAVIRSARVLRGDVLRDPLLGGRALKGAALQRTALAAEERLTGASFAGVARRAKSIVLNLGDAGRIVVTPRFTGALLIGEPAENPYDCLQMQLADGRTLTYRDMRRLGTFALMDSGQYAAWDASLGPEPLDPELTPERFSGILRGSGRAVKTVLMDQRKLAGVGNIYANEACWRAGIRPARRGISITRPQAATLLQVLQDVLRESIALRGTTFRDFQDAYGGKGGFAAHLAVYGRGGLACLRCGATLKESHKLEGRSTVWCASCQS